MLPMRGQAPPNPPQLEVFGWHPPHVRFEENPWLYASIIREEHAKFIGWWQRNGLAIFNYTTLLMQSLPENDRIRRNWLEFSNEIFEVRDFLEAELGRVNGWEQWEYS